MGRIPIACTLSASNQVVRADEWEHLKRTAMTRAMTREGARLTFAPGTVSAADIADLVERETACCPFFVFTLEVRVEHLTLTVATHDGSTEIIAALVH